MDVIIQPGKLSGRITPPPSKSQAHRLVIGAALSGGESTLKNIDFSQDILATLTAMEQLGAKWQNLGEGNIKIFGVGADAPREYAETLPQIDCGESGSTLRFLIPIALALTGGGVFTGHGRLMQRPQEPYFRLFREKGIEYAWEGDTLTVRGRLSAGDYTLAGNVSSQFFTGLLYALSLVPGESTVRSTTALESRSYIDMTLDALRAFGGRVSELPGGFPGFRVTGRDCLEPRDCTVEADWSQAAFYYSALGLGNTLEIRGMNPDSAQGDRVIARYHEALGGHGEVILNVEDCPDLVPPLAVHAALRGAGNLTHIVGAGRLRIKESDRLQSVTAALNALGAQVQEEPEGLTVFGTDALRGGTVDACNDHRIAMMAAVAATACREPVTILGADCVRKSYPGFWTDYAALGGQITMEERQ